MTPLKEKCAKLGERLGLLIPEKYLEKLAAAVEEGCEFVSTSKISQVWRLDITAGRKHTIYVDAWPPSQEGFGFPKRMSLGKGKALSLPIGAAILIWPDVSAEQTASATKDIEDTKAVAEEFVKHLNLIVQEHSRYLPHDVGMSPWPTLGELKNEPPNT